jgi:hypothetical protein
MIATYNRFHADEAVSRSEDRRACGGDASGEASGSGFIGRCPRWSRIRGSGPAACVAVEVRFGRWLVIEG